MDILDYSKNVRSSELTIISVSFGSKHLLRLNLRLTRALNPECTIHWIVVENAPEDHENRLLRSDKDFYVLPGVPLSRAEKQNVGYGSLAHAKAINIAVSYVATSAYLLIDPDCYIVKFNWIGWIQNKLRDEKLGFFGTPYHPERLSHFTPFKQTYMYFPTAICMAVNKKLIEERGYFYSDYSPDCNGKLNQIGYQRMLHELATAASLPIRTRIRLWVTAFFTHGPIVALHKLRVTPKRFRFDRRYDIGHKMHDFYRKKVGVATTSVRFVRSLPPLFGLWKRCIPQSILAFPKKHGYWTRQKMPFVHDNLESQGRWEEFFAKCEPFAFHIGKVTYCGDKSDFAVAEGIVNEIIELLLKDKESVL